MAAIVSSRVVSRRSFAYGVTTPELFKPKLFSFSVVGVGGSNLTHSKTTPSRFASHYQQRRFLISSASISASLPPSLRREEHEYRGPKTWPSVYEEARDMATVSNLSYPITFLIRQAKAGNLKDSPKVLERLQLIRDGDPFSGPLSPRELLEIVEDNRDCIEREYCSQRDLESPYGWFHALNHWVQVEENRNFIGSLSLLEFDDHYDAHRLAYGLVINRIKKHIVVVFRGTCAEGTDDWKRNLQSDKVEIPVPPNLLQWDKQRRRQGGKQHHHTQDPLPSTIKIHRGLYEYLFDNPQKGPRFKRQRYEEILNLLMICLRENPDYDVYVTGHSLGGALAEIFAFYLATTISNFEEYLPTMPHVTCVCIGSMVTGDVDFARTISYLEQKKGLRHLRVTNEDDPVCYYPPLDGYTPSGMQLRFNRHSGHALWHPQTKRKFVPISLDGGDESDEEANRDTIGNTLYQCKGSDMAETANSWPNLIRALHSSVGLGTSYIQEHTVPTYLRQLEREKEFLSRITLADLQDEEEESEPMDTTTPRDEKYTASAG